MSKFYRLSFSCVFIVILLSGFALAQSRVTGIIEGRVSDEEGSALPGVTMTITSPNLMGIQTAIFAAVRTISIVAVIPAWMMILVLLMVVKPCRDASTSYVPVGNVANRYFPSASVTAV